MWKGRKKNSEENEIKRYTKREMCALITQRNEMKLQTFNLSVRVWICKQQTTKLCVLFFHLYSFFSFLLSFALHVSTQKKMVFYLEESGLCVLLDCFQFFNMQTWIRKAIQVQSIFFLLLLSPTKCGSKHTKKNHAVFIFCLWKFKIMSIKITKACVLNWNFTQFSLANIYIA